MVVGTKINDHTFSCNSSLTHESTAVEYSLNSNNFFFFF